MGCILSNINDILGCNALQYIAFKLDLITWHIKSSWSVFLVFPRGDMGLCLTRPEMIEVKVCNRQTDSKSLKQYIGGSVFFYLPFGFALI